MTWHVAQVPGGYALLGPNGRQFGPARPLSLLAELQERAALCEAVRQLTLAEVRAQGIGNNGHRGKPPRGAERRRE